MNVTARTDALTGLQADAAARTITGRLAVYDTPGTTNAGRTVLHAGSIAAAEPSHVALLVEHDRNRPVGYATALDESAGALWASFHLPPGPDADAALAAAADGTRTGLSVGLEITASHRDTAGVLHVTASALREGSLVSVPAYTATRVTDVAATLPDEPPAPEPPPPAPPQPEPPAVVAAAAPPLAPPARAAARGPESMADLYGMLTAAYTGRGDGSIQAALADITNTANTWAAPQQYAGELWSHVAYARQIVPLVAGRPLTSYKVTGWRWTVPPAVGPYVGDKTDVPSNPAATEAVAVDAERLAGAHDIDRKYRDFGDTEFFASYYAAMAESYAHLSDDALLAALLAEATAYAPPAGAPIWSAIVGAALEVGKKAPSSFVVLGANVLHTLVDTPTAAAPAFLSILPNNPLGSIATSPSMPADDVLVGARDAATFYELGGSPIRVEAVDMTKGGIDPGVFGYYATIVNQPLALQRFTMAAPGAASGRGRGDK